MSAVTDSELERLRTFMSQALPRYLADLERLVNIDCGSYTKKGVDEVGEWFGKQMKDLGADVTVDHNEELGNTVVSVIEGMGGSDHVLLIGHLDTVFDEGTAADRPYSTADGRAYGPGVNDMKAGLLSGLYALRALQSMGPLPFAKVTYVANPDEEIGSPQSTPVIREVAEKIDVCFVLESARANGDIVSARKGIADYIVTIEGRAAHAGVEPEKGRSAIL